MVSNLNFSREIFFFGTLCALLLQGCTKETPLQAVYSGESDWAPGFHIYFNNYQRIYGTIDSVPRISLLRNINRLEVQGRLSSADSFTAICTGYLSYNAGSTGSFVSPPVLQMGQSYVMRLAILYKNGVVRYSSDTAIITTVVHGKILKSFPNVSFPNSGNIWFKDSSIITYYGATSGWASVDTSNGSVRSITTQPLSLSSSNFNLDFPVALSGDTAYFEPSSYIWGQGITLLRFNLKTGWIDSTLVLKGSGGNFDRVTACASKIALSWFSGSEGLVNSRLAEYDPITGEVIDQCSIPFSAYSMTYVGNELWVVYSGPDGFNRIGRVDFSADQIDESYESPVFSSVGLTWDGSNFWVFDYYNLSLAKLLLESD